MTTTGFKYILLVDDEPEICLLLSNILRRAGTECAIAHSLEQGRAALQSSHFDAVFVDVHLPDGLGYDLIPDIKASQPGARSIAISAVDAERDRAVAAGADLFVAKPFNRAIILSSIRQLGLPS